MSTQLSIQQLSSFYGQRQVLKNISFEVSEGEMLGFLGPNGSGKTTLLKILAGLITPTAGDILFEHKKLIEHRILRRHLGIVFQDPSLDTKLTVKENLLLGAALHAVPKKRAYERMQLLLDLVELHNRENDRVSTLSGGLRRRLELVRALIHEPTLLFLDEPTTGLDALAQERFWYHIQEIRNLQPLTLIVNTHLASEAERCDRLLILDEGAIVANNVPAQLLTHMSSEVLVIQSRSPDELAFAVHNTLGVLTYQIGDRVMIESKEAHALVPQIYEKIDAKLIGVLTVRKPSLADVFFKLTGRRLGQIE